MTDRKELEVAIKWSKDRLFNVAASFDPVAVSRTQTLIDAAQAWLETLPQPEWSVRVWANEADICTVSRFYDRGDAIEFVISVTRTPMRKVEIEAP